MHVRKISNVETWPVRNEILRPGLPVSTCHFAEDELQDAVHFGAYEAERLTGVVSAYPIAFSGDRFLRECWQLRAMATVVSVRGMGHGATLVSTLESYLVEQSAQWLWCNARQAAIGFYLKCGFEMRGDAFDIAGIGEHRPMLKQLNNSGELV